MCPYAYILDSFHWMINTISRDARFITFCTSSSTVALKFQQSPQLYDLLQELSCEGLYFNAVNESPVDFIKELDRLSTCMIQWCT